MNKKFIGGLTIVFLLFAGFDFFFITQVSARSGCCSHHGGVCGCGCCDGTSLSKTCAPYYPECSEQSNSAKTNNPSLSVPALTPNRKPSTPKPTVRPTVKPTVKLTPKPTPLTVSCSNIFDNVCPKQCTVGNDIDCCTKKNGYTWFENYGCYPATDSYCSATQDDSCSSMCSAGNDFDCCLKKSGYTWYLNRGCYQN